MDFGSFTYVPVLRTRHDEFEGFRHLPEGDRTQILPLFEVGWAGRDSDIDQLRDRAASAAQGHPFLLDLNKAPAPDPFRPTKEARDPIRDRERIDREAEVQASYNKRLGKLCNPAAGYSEWREFVAAAPNAIPVVQWADLTAGRLQVMRQVFILSKTGPVALRIPFPFADAALAFAGELVSIVEDPSRILLIFDCGIARLQYAEKPDAVVRAIDAVASKVDATERSLIQAVCLSGSYPSGSQPGYHSVDILDRDLWREASRDFHFLYGDYAASERLKNSFFTPSSWSASVFLPTETQWHSYRCENLRDPAGWVEGARCLIDKGIDVPNVWGGDMIRSTYEGKGGEFNSPRFWRAGRINMHLHVKANYTRADDE
jgi:hypothetical protein